MTPDDRPTPEPPAVGSTMPPPAATQDSGPSERAETQPRGPVHDSLCDDSLGDDCVGDGTVDNGTIGNGDVRDSDVGAEGVEVEMEQRLGRMPREIGVLLLTIGVVGVVLPGIVGTPALLAGGLMLWPRGFRGINGWLRRRCPKAHAKGMEQLLRYLDDMQRRYPS
jgi:hypothetical protein